ncbi:hypothetical protein LB577_04975 [Mesorhizobium sp. B283B1A]|uniref:hypothetical protein n=1 Tax=Mesorhizobium TaxID=68287 RepID=UPI001CD12657|nr:MULTISPECIES: hypothetical protein [Mesorhizobium]MCA0046307.1 hypothetical protein [Mesorhizobium sp. B283B1A]UQS62777.1 hypothetical protein M5D98_21810 [Mesorhizobium opportunistum]
MVTLKLLADTKVLWTVSVSTGIVYASLNRCPSDEDLSPITLGASIKRRSIVSLDEAHVIMMKTAVARRPRFLCGECIRGLLERRMPSSTFIWFDQRC